MCEERDPIVWIVYNDGIRDFSRAEKFGMLKTIVSGQYHNGFLKDSSNMVNFMREVLREYQPGDYLLMVGEPALCGIAITIAREMSSEHNINLLRWNNHLVEYIALELKLSPLEFVPTRAELVKGAIVVGPSLKESQEDFNIR